MPARITRSSPTTGAYARSGPGSPAGRGRSARRAAAAEEARREVQGAAAVALLAARPADLVIGSLESLVGRMPPHPRVEPQSTAHGRRGHGDRLIGPVA